MGGKAFLQKTYPPGGFYYIQGFTGILPYSGECPHGGAVRSGTVSSGDTTFAFMMGILGAIKALIGLFKMLSGKWINNLRE